MQRWAEKTELPLSQLIGWAGIARGRFYDWKQRYGKANERRVGDWRGGPSGMSLSVSGVSPFVPA